MQQPFQFNISNQWACSQAHSFPPAISSFIHLVIIATFHLWASKPESCPRRSSAFDLSSSEDSPWFCQKFRVSVVTTGAAAIAVSTASLASFHCSINSASFTPTTFLAIYPHISQVLLPLVCATQACLFAKSMLSVLLNSFTKKSKANDGAWTSDAAGFTR